MLFASAAYSQADTIFVLASEFGAVTVLTDSTYQVAIEHPADQLGQGFLPTKIRVGYLLFDSYGRRYRVKTIVSANFGQSVLDVVELQDNNIGPLGVGIVHRKPDDSDCVPEIPGGNTGLAPATLARIHNHNVANGCGGGSGNQTAAQVDIDTILTLPAATNVQNALEEAGANINALAGSIPTLTSELTNDVPFLVTETPQTLSIATGSITLSDGGGTVGLISTDGGNTIAAGADGKLYSAAGAGESTTVSDTPTIDLTLTGSDITGEVVAGSIGATQLASTGITPATYTNANVTFDADGRATAASNGTGGGVATVVAGTGISVNATDPANPCLLYTSPSPRDS